MFHFQLTCVLKIRQKQWESRKKRANSDEFDKNDPSPQRNRSRNVPPTKKKQLGRDLKLPRVRNGINKKERQASAASGPIVLDSRRCPFTLSVFFFLSFFVFFFFCSASPARHLRLVFSPFPSALVVAVVSCIIHSNWRNSFTSCSHVAVPLLFLRPIFTYFCRVCYF